MSMVILLDAGPLGLITNPRASQETRECNQWLESLALKEIEVKIPEIADFEVRRELLRADKALDGDVILAAQAILIQDEGHEVIIATTNVGHLSRLAQAKTWRDIG